MFTEVQTPCPHLPGVLCPGDVVFQKQLEEMNVGAVDDDVVLFISWAGEWTIHQNISGLGPFQSTCIYSLAQQHIQHEASSPTGRLSSSATGEDTLCGSSYM